EVFFRNANGERLILQDSASVNLSSTNSINFSLRKIDEKYFNVNFCLVLFCATLSVWFILPGTLIPLVVVCVLTLGHKSFITSGKQDTLLIVESIGVHIRSKHTVYILNRHYVHFTSTSFFSWNMIEDVFINEVIKGQRVLYYLTFIVKESTDRQDSRRLVPVFQDLLPERKCLEYIYRRLANLIGSTQRR
ncbi:Phosphatidylinositol N-acetylglucosaminyltransferase subunit H, partial [Camponotus floridanus]